MSKFNNANNFQTIVELLYEEIKTFRSETREENKQYVIEKVIELLDTIDIKIENTPNGDIVYNNTTLFLVNVKNDIEKEI